MANVVYGGYMGLADIDGIKIRCNDFNVKLTQDVLFYDHIIGLRDSIPGSIFDSKGDNAAWNEQKIFYRPGVKIVEGPINFPLAELSSNAFFAEAWSGDDFDVTLYYSCETGKTFKKCKINSYAFSATAGEVASVTVNVMGVDVGEGEGTQPYTIAEKLITWDVIKIAGAGAQEGIVSFEFTINNNCIPIYTAGTNVSSPLLVHEIRVGMQTVTGSISFYNDLGPEDEFVENATPRHISVSAGDLNINLSVLYQYPERNGQVSPYIKTIPFVGVGHAVQG